ncbi:hypothetical protein [Hwanghaeella sp.]|uniref:hypothetical protein n=1 Tax=Hwanghaeella sp. TaxID=2605943 RepID=UPI003CCB89E2
MPSRFLWMAAGLMATAAVGSTHAATIELAPIGAGSAPTVISAPGSVSQTFSNVLSSSTDLFGATVIAEAHDSTGVLKAFANHGGDVGTLFPSQASAIARLSGTGTISGVVTGPVQGSLIYNFHAAADTLTGQSGAALGGFSTAALNVSADVGTFFNIFRPGQSPVTGFTSAQGSLQYVSEQFFTASSPSTLSNVQSLSGIRSSGVFRNSPSVNNVLSDNDISISVSRVSDFIIEGVIEILFTAQIGDRMRFSADLTAVANAAPGHIAGINALNTGTLSLVLPQGVDFLPDDGIFLTDQQSLTSVPLPPSAALLLAGLTGLGLLRKRRKAIPKNLEQGAV